MDQARLKDQPSLRLTRSYPVEPEKVWRAWTEPQALRRWFGPGAGEPVSAAEVDLRVGGRFRIVFGGADGKAHECAGVYREVVPHRRLVFSWCWPRTTPERVSQVTIVLAPEGGGTLLEFRHEQLHDEAARDGHLRGWTASLAKLDGFLQGGQ